MNAHDSLPLESPNSRIYFHLSRCNAWECSASTCSLNATASLKSTSIETDWQRTSLERQANGKCILITNAPQLSFALISFDAIVSQTKWDETRPFESILICIVAGIRWKCDGGAKNNFQRNQSESKTQSFGLWFCVGASTGFCVCDTFNKPFTSASISVRFPIISVHPLIHSFIHV